MPRMFLLYEALLHLVFLLFFPLFLVVGFLRGKYFSNFRDRLGRYRHHAATHDLWVHAVSVGEVMAARTILDAVKKLRPELSVVITTTTITGQQTARRVLPGATVTYFPFDFTRSVRRFLDHHAPRMLLLVETEIWPNVSRLCAARGITILLTNGRISDRSFPRYRAVRGVLRRVLRHYSAILVREEIDRQRFVEIGAPSGIVHVVGNVKFDHVPDSTPLAFAGELEAAVGGRPVVVFGSTVESEDELIGPLIERTVRELGAFVVIAPRKPERFEFVAGMIAASELDFARRSEWDAWPERFDVLVLDSIGELARLYSLATAAFVGGSLLAGTGGHNPIEPAAVGAPVAFGPHMSNFREIAAVFVESGSAVQVADGDQLWAFISTMVRDPEERERRAAAARDAVKKNQGAAERTARAIVEALP